VAGPKSSSSTAELPVCVSGSLLGNAAADTDGVGSMALGMLGCGQSRVVFPPVLVSDPGGEIGSDTRLPRSGSAMTDDGKHGSWGRGAWARGGKADGTKLALGTKV
jgi:hypothetical protein